MQGQPVTDARVTAAGIDRRTGTDGVVTFEVAPGLLHITVSKQGFVETVADVTSPPDRAHTRDRRSARAACSRRRGDGRREHAHRPAARGRAGARRGARTRRNRREDAHDAWRHRHDAERDGRHARAGDVAVASAPRACACRACADATRASCRDGLPLFGQQVGGLGLLQIPPMDLGQVEVIKGAASALYGAGAMGGVVNLMSRRPGRRARARDAGQPLDARRHRRRGFLSSPLGPRLERVASSAAGIGRRATTSTTMAGRMSPGYGAASRGRGCSGMAAAAARHS